MGLADLRVVREQSVEVRLEQGPIAGIAATLATLAEAGHAEMAAQGLPTAAVRTESRLLVRYEGTDSSIEIAFATDVAQPCAKRSRRHTSSVRLCHDATRPWSRQPPSPRSSARPTVPDEPKHALEPRRGQSGRRAGRCGPVALAERAVLRARRPHPWHVGQRPRRDPGEALAPPCSSPAGRPA